MLHNKETKQPLSALPRGLVLSENELSASYFLLDHLNIAVLLVNQQNEIAFASHLFCELFHLSDSKKTIVGASHSEVIQHYIGYLIGISSSAEMVEKTLLIAEQKETNTDYYLLQRPHLQWIQRQYSPISIDKEVWHLWQFSPLIETNHIVDNIEKGYRQIIENLSLGLLEVDNDDKILQAYPAFCDMVGYTPSELIGQYAHKIFTPASYHELIQQQALSRKERKTGVYELPMRKKNGDVIWVIISGGPITDTNGEVIGSVGIHLDITPQKQLYQALEQATSAAQRAQKAEKHFLANMSHELRTPLNAVIGISHLLYQTNPTEQQLEYLDVLLNAANIVHQLISDILDIAKIEAGDVKPQPEVFSLAPLLHSLSKTFQFKAGQKNILFCLDIDEGLQHIWLYGDKLMLNQILLNLLGNAEKFTEQGQITLSAELLPRTTPQQVELHFEVSDTGIGISEDNIKILFQKFKQAQNQSRKYGGTGLGLAICKQLIELQGGTIKVNSIANKGTTFSFTLPYHLAEAPQSHQQIPITLPLPKSPLRFLVVEDNDMNRYYLTRILAKTNCSVDIATTGAEAIALSQQYPYDLILMDIQLPDMDGYNITTIIRQSESPNTHTPIIALTASAYPEKQHHALKVGMNDYLTKPFTPQQLQQVVQKTLQVQFPIGSATLGGGKSANHSNYFMPPLDVAYLNSFYDDNIEHASIIFETFLSETVPMLLKLPDILNQPNPNPKFCAALHKIKPAFAMVGLTTLQQQVASLESHIQKNIVSNEEIHKKINLIIQNLQQFIPILRANLEFFRKNI